MRILISDTNPEAVKNAPDNIKPDSDFHRDRDAALARSRAEAIDVFTPKPLWVVKAHISVPLGSFFATWKPKDEQDGLNYEKRLVDKSVGEALVTRLKEKHAVISNYECKKQSLKPPVGVSLPKLQRRGIDVIEKLSSIKVPQNVDKSCNTPVFNSKKVEEHHTIIPSASCTS